MTRRVNVSGGPIPGYGDGRPLPDTGRAISPEREALLQAWAALFLDAPGELSDAGRRVLEDVARHCHGGATTARPDSAGRADPIASALAEGRRQALLFIVSRLNLKGLMIL